MFHWLVNWLVRRAFRSRRGSFPVRELESLARSGTAAWLLAQQRARVEYLAAKERCCTSPTWATFRQMLERLAQLSSTNALVHALLNEQALERLLAEAQPQPAPPEPATRRCA